MGPRDALATFAELDDPKEQLAFWDERLDTRRFRAALAAVLAPVRLVPGLPRRLDRVVRGRLRRGFATHPNRSNPYARGLLLGELPAAGSPRTLKLTLEVADAAAFLERCAPGSFDGFALSNVLDGSRENYAGRLRAAVARAAAPGAVFVLRTFAEARSAEEADRAARDRALLWGAVRVDAAC